MSPGPSEVNTRIYSPSHENLYSAQPKGLSEYKLSCLGEPILLSPQKVPGNIVVLNVAKKSRISLLSKEITQCDGLIMYHRLKSLNSSKFS